MSAPGRILVVGLGGVAGCTLPLLFRHLGVDPSRYTVVDFGDVAVDDVRYVEDSGARFVRGRIAPQNHRMLSWASTSAPAISLSTSPGISTPSRCSTPGGGKDLWELMRDVGERVIRHSVAVSHPGSADDSKELPLAV